MIRNYQSELTTAGLLRVERETEGDGRHNRYFPLEDPANDEIAGNELPEIFPAIFPLSADSPIEDLGIREGEKAEQQGTGERRQSWTRHLCGCFMTVAPT